MNRPQRRPRLARTYREPSAYAKDGCTYCRRPAVAVLEISDAKRTLAIRMVCAVHSANTAHIGSQLKQILQLDLSIRLLPLPGAPPA